MKAPLVRKRNIEKDNDKAQNKDVMELKINLELVVELKMKTNMEMDDNMLCAVMNRRTLADQSIGGEKNMVG